MLYLLFYVISKYYIYRFATKTIQELVSELVCDHEVIYCGI